MWRQSAYLGPWVGPLAGRHHLLKKEARHFDDSNGTGPLLLPSPPLFFFVIYLRHLYGAWFRWAFARTYNTHCDNKSKRFWFILLIRSRPEIFNASDFLGGGGRIRRRDLFVRRRRNCPAKYLYSTRGNVQRFLGGSELRLSTFLQKFN